MVTQVKKSSWIVPLVACLAAIGVLVVWDTWYAPAPPIAGFIAFALVAVGFLYTYLSDTERMWWAIIPSLSAVSLIGALAADLVVGTDPSNDWASVVVFGIGMALTGVVLKRVDAKSVLYTIATISLGVAALMAPIAVVLKVVLAAAVVVVGIAVILTTRRGISHTTSGGGLTPQA
jgi:hypothetical protein